MEDYLAVRLSPNEEFNEVPHLKEQAYIGVFDGHGGKEAAKCARERLWDIIQSQPKYKLSDVSSVKESLQEAFLALHEEMEPLRGEFLIVFSSHLRIPDSQQKHSNSLCIITHNVPVADHTLSSMDR